MFFVSGNAANAFPTPRSPAPRPAPAPRPRPSPQNSQRGANEPVDIAPMALLHAQQVMLAQMDVAQLVIIPVTAPMHMVQEWKTLQKNPFTGAVVGSSIRARAEDPVQSAVQSAGNFSFVWCGRRCQWG